MTDQMTELTELANGTKITIASAELKRPRTVTVTGSDDGTLWVTSGRTRSGNLDGGQLWFDKFRDCIVFQPTPLQTPVDVAGISVAS